MIHVQLELGKTSQRILLLLSLSKKYLGKKELKHFSSAGLKALFLQITNLAEFAKSFYACKRLTVSTRLDRTNPPTAAEAGISTERHQKNNSPIHYVLLAFGNTR